MERVLQDCIERQAKKLLEREKRLRYRDKKYQTRYFNRSGKPASVAEYKPPAHWALHPHFEPKYCIQHSRYLAKTLWKKILSKEYAPIPAVLFSIPKVGGGKRDIMVFSIPDAAVANLLNRKMRDRNKSAISPFCFSYQKDRGVFDATLQLQSFLNEEKCYVVQYDFSKYFDTIEHGYIQHMLEKSSYLVTDLEKKVISSFLQHKFARLSQYPNKSFETRDTGVPQGCSLSLFLSNLAGHELDENLGKRNGRFVRFADDVVCVANNHDDALAIAEVFRAHCGYSGIKINYEKSPGISLLKSREKRSFFVGDGDGDALRIDSEFDYLGHKFTSQSIGVSTKAISRIKKRIGKIIHIHLLLTPRSRKLFNEKRVGALFVDWDLVTCINEIRQFIYGGQKERSLTNFILKNERLGKLRGVMGFYPLVNTADQFILLDGWLLDALGRALKERYKVLSSEFNLNHPFQITKTQLLDGSWFTLQTVKVECKLPSFVLAWRASRKSFRQFGFSDFRNPSYYSSLEGVFGY
jgi:RNA-directed DNA polymerase